MLNSSDFLNRSQAHSISIEGETSAQRQHRCSVINKIEGEIFKIYGKILDISTSTIEGQIEYDGDVYYSAFKVHFKDEHLQNFDVLKIQQGYYIEFVGRVNYYSSSGTYFDLIEIKHLSPVDKFAEIKEQALRKENEENKRRTAKEKTGIIFFCAIIVLSFVVFKQYPQYSFPAFVVTFLIWGYVTKDWDSSFRESRSNEGAPFLVLGVLLGIFLFWMYALIIWLFLS